MDMRWFVVATCMLLLSSIAEGSVSNLRVSDVTANIAKLWWTIGDEELDNYKVQCVGVDHYVNALGEHRTALHKRTQYVPQGLKGLNHVLLGGLKPNFVYSCNVTEELVNQEHRGVPSRTKSFNEFATGYAAPEAPRAPVIHTSHDDGNTNVTVELFRATTKNGPISGYMVQFHVIDPQAPYFVAGLPLIEDELLDPFGQLNTQEMARRTSYPISFKMSFSGGANSTLPSKIPVGIKLLKGAIKNGIRYSVLTVAFTVMERKRLKEQRVVLFTPSKPSETFVPFVRGLITKKLLSRTQKVFLVVFGIVLPSALSLYIVMFLALILYIRFLQPSRRKWSISSKLTSHHSSSTVSHTGEEWEAESIPLLDMINRTVSHDSTVPQSHTGEELEMESIHLAMSRTVSHQSCSTRPHTDKELKMECIHLPIEDLETNSKHLLPHNSSTGTHTSTVPEKTSIHIPVDPSDDAISSAAENSSSGSSLSYIINVFDSNGNFRQSFHY